ncbi:TlpA family protein disulfide reductase [Sphingobacterium psychroaquaticum]|uniref:TlpA family protein disulfide reductase n=1 Tax=Sphingobacterium psychroaquaticum TaxID=561061 RepID=UPI001F0FAEF5|nr:TlpA disulfide reductase family protein [Sphingobacterium psychroaquaticum]
MKNKETSKEKPVVNRIWQYPKKNIFTLLIVIFVGSMLFSPDAKSFVLRQLMATGIFNASIDKKEDDATSQINAHFEFMDEKGNIQNTSTLRGKVVFINFWASWCPPCRAEFPSIQKFHEKYEGNDDLVFLTINLDDEPQAGKLYLEKEKFTIPFLIPNGNIPNEYFSGSLPTTVVLDKTGKIRMHHAGMADYSKDSFYEEINQLLKD